METSDVTTNHVELKKKVLDAAIKKHQTVIDDFSGSIKEMLASEGIVNEDEMDLSQQEFNTELVHKSNQIADQLAFANEEMKILFDMAPVIGSIHNTIQPGSVVVTDRENFFVSTSVEAFSAGGMDFFGLSTQSPLFKAMEGKKSGDHFSHNYSDYRVIEVF
ncbi:MAG: hypothetical protein WA874_21550 [Chryseosolibacter sp.]